MNASRELDARRGRGVYGDFLMSAAGERKSQKDYGYSAVFHDFTLPGFANTATKVAALFCGFANTATRT